ncbi:MAG: hypothetical protein ACRC8S_06105 [Fimbriiglobus sp.]
MDPVNLKTDRSSDEEFDAALDQLRLTWLPLRITLTRYAIEILIGWLVITYVCNNATQLWGFALAAFYVAIKITLSWFFRAKAIESIDSNARNIWFGIWFMMPAFLALIPVIWDLISLIRRNEGGFLDFISNNPVFSLQLLFPLLVLLFAHFTLPGKVPELVNAKEKQNHSESIKDDPEPE